MTRTEERLREALHASAARVRDDRLRPLPAVETGSRAPRRHAGWLVPLAAAVSVLAVVALAVAVAGAHRAHRAPAVGYPALPAGFPRYFADFADPPQTDVVIRSTSTGAVVATVPTPDLQDWRLTPETIAAAPDGRTFYVTYCAVSATASPSVNQIWIYQLTFANRADGTSTSSLEWIRGNPFPGTGLLVNGGSMAVSPDGTRLALTTATRTQPDGQHWPDAIIVVDLRTGARSVWQGGMSRPGQTFTIPGLSWTPDGRSLVFVSVWCRPTPNSNVCLDQPGQPGYRGTQVRSLDAGATGGALSRTTLRVSQSPRYPVIADAVAGQRGELIVAVLSGSADAANLTVERVNAATGKPLGAIYRSTAYTTVGLPASVTLTPDPALHYLLIAYDTPKGLVSGWLDHGKLRYLPAQYPVPSLPITAW
jgi:hypothetical protein